MGEGVHRLMDVSTNFSITLKFDSVKDQSENLGWGELALAINENLVWFQQDEESSPESGRSQPRLVHWTWVELLSYLGENWAHLMYEEIYPLDLQPETPLDLRGMAEKRWVDAQLDEEQVFDEDEEVFDFERRHNLASGLKGIFLPSIYIVREGNLAWVCSKADHGKETSEVWRFSFEVIKQTLMDLGDKIANHLEHSTHQRAVRAVAIWKRALEQNFETIISLRSGLNESDLLAFAAANDQDYWELNSQYDDSEILAAARLTPGNMELTSRKQLLDVIKLTPYRATPELDSLSAECSTVLSENDGARPFVQGNAVALWLRDRLNISLQQQFDPFSLLESWGVSVSEINTQEDLEALAFWGRSHGPAILINKSGAINAKTSGVRTTLAHEIGHLLMDRSGSLPFADAIGGNTPEWIEKRARAFAAELLLPRELIKSIAQGYFMISESQSYSEDLDQVIKMASRELDVSTGLVIHQLYNSRIQDSYPDIRAHLGRLHQRASRWALLG